MTDISFPSNRRSIKPILLCLGLGLTSPHLLAEDKVTGAVDLQSEVVQENQDSQVKVDQLSDQASQLLDDFRLVVSETESLRSYNDQMTRLVSSQEKEMASIRKQILEIETTNKEVVPLMLKMLDSLESFVALDVPFLKEERQRRVDSLREMMDRADVSTSEKYRRVLEAFQVENEYGRSIEAYSETINTDGENRTVDFLRIGRVALIYQTLDGREARLWDQGQKDWVELPGRYRSAINDGLRIARRQAAPDILTLPIPAPEGAKL